jgi:hypothetical protein
MERLRSGVSPEQRLAIRKALVRFTAKHAKRFGCAPEAVVQEIRYWQQSNPDWPTNPKQADKQSSFERHHGICQAPGCGETIASIDDATFHHLHKRDS